MTRNIAHKMHESRSNHVQIVDMDFKIDNFAPHQNNTLVLLT